MKTILLLLCLVSFACAEERLIPDVNASYYDAALKERGFQLKVSGGAEQVEKTWSLRINQTDMRVTVYSPASDRDSVKVISGVVVNDDNDPAVLEKVAAPFFGWLSRMPSPGSEPDTTEMWVKTHAGQRTEKIFSGVKFQLFGSSTSARTLRISTDPPTPTTEMDAPTPSTLPAVKHLDPETRGKNAKIPEVGATFADVQWDNGNPVIRDPDTGWATWPTFKVLFKDGRAAEVVKR